jgi:fumarylacetoacetase
MVFIVNVAEDSPFTFHNDPFGVISTDATPRPHCATAIGDYAVYFPLYWKYRSSENLERLSVSCESLHDIFNQVSVSIHQLKPVKLNLIPTAMSERI